MGARMDELFVIKDDHEHRLWVLEQTDSPTQQPTRRPTQQPTSSPLGAEYLIYYNRVSRSNYQCPPGYLNINDKTECQTASTFLGFNYQTDLSWPNEMSGCMNDDPEGSNNIYFNNIAGQTAAANE